MRKNVYYWGISILLFAITQSCSNHIETIYESDLGMEQYIEDNFISENEILQTAESIFAELSPKLSTYSSGTSTAKKNVKNIKTKKDKNNIPAYYVTNFEDGGWIIFSADKRTISIMAFSDNGSFDMDAEDMPLGLSSWMNTMTTTVEYVRDTDTDLNEISPTNTNNVSTYASDGGKNDPSYESETNKITNQINVIIHLNTETGWRQTADPNKNNKYNAKMPIICADERASAGCAIVALAQLMKFYSYPNSYKTGDGYGYTGKTSYYDWSQMYPYVSTSQVQQLYVDLATDANADYRCVYTGSSYVLSTAVNMGNAANTLYHYGYSYTYKKYDGTSCIVELLNGRPCLLYAYDPGKSVGHLWICDGYGVLNNQYVLHMNWGWNIRYNGYFWENSWNPGPYVYNSDQWMFTNVKPRI